VRAERIGRATATSGGVLILLYALVSGVGGPPSEFCQTPPYLADALFGYLPAFYLGGALLALVGLVQSAVGSRVGRWSSTCGGILSSVGNLVCYGIAAPHEARGALWLAATAIPLVLVIWMPFWMSRRIHERPAANGV